MIKKIFLLIFLALSTNLLLYSVNKKNEQPTEPIQQYRNYSFDQNSKLIDRATDVPDFALQYLIKLDGIKSYKNYKLNESEIDIFEQNIDLLPEIYKNELKDTLIGIYFIDNFWGSGLTHFVVDDYNNLYTIIFLNPKLLQLSLSEAYTMKENTCFKKDKNIRLEVELSETLNGILYVLLHETTHSIDFTKRITPFTHGEMLKYVSPFHESEITKQIWDNYYQLKAKYKSEIFSKISFYGFNNGPILKLSEAKHLYKKLEKTPFVSLYSTFSWAEDIADLYTIQYLVTNLGCDFNIKLYENNKLIYKKNLFDREVIKKRIVHNDLF